MKKRISIAVSVVALALLLIAGTVAVTVAYLTSEASVTNTFTVGQVKITLDEAPVDANGKKTTGDRRTDNTYLFVPGGVYDKDPTIHVDAASSDCYLFVKVTNDLAPVEDSSNTIAKQLEDNGWLPVNGATNVYYYERVATAADTNIPVFTTVKIAATATNDALAGIVNAEGKGFVTVIAYAIQVDGFADAAAAWTAAPADWKN